VTQASGDEREPVAPAVPDRALRQDPLVVLAPAPATVLAPIASPAPAPPAPPAPAPTPAQAPVPAPAQPPPAAADQPAPAVEEPPFGQEPETPASDAEPALPTPARGLLLERELPAWPLTLLLVFYPVIWASGLSAFALPVVGVLCLGLLIMRGGVRLPPLWLLWTAFLVWSTTSVVMIDTLGRLAGFVQRWTSLVGATLLALYVYNARTSLTRRTVLQYCTVFFGWLVVGGYLGMQLPYGRISTPIQALMPASLANNPYVVDLLSPRFAEVQKPWGVEQAFVRPSAPFVYTNGWGHAYVLLLPLVVAYLLHASRRGRLVAVALILLSVPPALATLNRGIFIGVGVAALYLALRLARRLTFAGWVRLLALGAVVGAGVLTFGAGSLARLTERTSSGESVSTRQALYSETFRRTLDSPWLGQGAPRPSETASVSAGTQGHVWYVMFSYGFVGLALFLLTLWGFALTTWRVRSLETLLLQTPLVVVNVMIAFYGLDGMHLVVVLVCFAVLVRGSVRERVEPQPPPVPAREPPRVLEGAAA
jgi:hypothetical protein